MNEHFQDTQSAEPLSPAEMLALASDQQRSVEGQMGGFVPYILVAWGIAWLGGFGALWLMEGGFGDEPLLPAAVAVPLFAALLVGAAIVSGVLGMRSGRGLRGSRANAFTGIVYGQLWWVGSLAVWLFGQAMVVNGMDAVLLGVFYPTAYIFFAGVMYVAAAVIWKAIPMLVLGAWSILLSAVAPFVGHPTHYLIYALGGGGAFLIACLISALWTTRARRRVREVRA